MPDKGSTSTLKPSPFPSLFTTTPPPQHQVINLHRQVGFVKTTIFCVNSCSPNTDIANRLHRHLLLRDAFKMIKTIAKASLVISFGLLTGCASMNQQECLNADWRLIGFEDALGRTPHESNWRSSQRLRQAQYRSRPGYVSHRL